MAVSHAKVSAVPDGGDATLVQPSDWNAGHTVSIVEAELALSDVATANVSATAHGFAPKAPNDATRYLDGTGAYSVPTPSVIDGGTP